MKNISLGLSLALAVCAQCFAEANWFTITGDKTDPTLDTIEVDAVPVSINGSRRIMQVRTSRSTPRTNWDGIAYRSYKATVEFDCVEKTAEYQQMTYYMQPAWAGESHISTSYTKSNSRPMRFRDIRPNPVERIIKAACNSASAAIN